MKIGDTIEITNNECNEEYFLVGDTGIILNIITGYIYFLLDRNGKQYWVPKENFKIINNTMKITHEGKEYELNAAKAIELKVLKPVIEIAGGQKYKYKYSSEVVTLIETSKGNFLLGGLGGNTFKLFSTSEKTKGEMEKFLDKYYDPA